MDEDEARIREEFQQHCNARRVHRRLDQQRLRGPAGPPPTAAGEGYLAHEAQEVVAPARALSRQSVLEGEEAPEMAPSVHEEERQVRRDAACKDPFTDKVSISN